MGAPTCLLLALVVVLALLVCALTNPPRAGRPRPSRLSPRGWPRAARESFSWGMWQENTEREN